LSCFCDEGLGDDSASFVAVGVGDARVAVASFEGGGDIAIDHIESAAPVEQLPDKPRPLTDDEVNGFFIAESAACAQGISDVRFEFVGFFEDRGDASLGVPGIAVFDGSFCNDGYGVVLRGLDCSAKACNAGADYQVVGRLLVRGNGVNINEIASEIRLEHRVITFFQRIQTLLKLSF